MIAATMALMMMMMMMILSKNWVASDFEVKVAGSEVNAGPEEEEEEEKVNLDITTLITLVSSVCHGAGCHFRFRDKVLDQQAAEEREKPSPARTPKVPARPHWKLAVSCPFSSCPSILDLLGGPRERQRAAELLNAVEIVDDQVSARAACLRPKGKVKDRSKVIFGTGDALKAVTVTANSGFIRAAKNQGISFAVHLHPARALTELKEATATPL
nr:hypothetical protein BaRGS_013578 [Batillaria attramentaria]